jgi:hypothetical protein
MARAIPENNLLNNNREIMNALQFPNENPEQQTLEQEKPNLGIMDALQFSNENPEQTLEQEKPNLQIPKQHHELQETDENKLLKNLNKKFFLMILYVYETFK